MRNLKNVYQALHEFDMYNRQMKWRFDHGLITEDEYYEHLKDENTLWRIMQR